MNPSPKVVQWFNQFESGLNTLLALLMWVMAFSLGGVVLLRYGFGYGATWLNEVAVYCLAITALLGLSFTYQQDKQVRLDILYSKFSLKSKLIVNLVGNIIFLIPLSLFLFSYSIDYVERSWLLSEGSAEASGLPALYLIKTCLLIGPALLLLRTFIQCYQQSLLIKKVINRKKR
ncbi:MAG TPA: C4-dicarboxylate ABC transporter permease [Gammaproteobacteria bacterium]|nr:C4-dicarboxylate ABC transporter permease [Gammaproteobacteria bacterium]HBF07212.1 C4-dicarboxylate ABC transporter permease [Gammaproteobacteria bacterium]HCK94412.1 C4-dicarboxylate ABC transporter permease [Gammaproteobacteria bacterium]|tara:strand:+ start:2655 stop:3179 length:525 start_codon:yes stop_codon:yes gene_type:complete